MEFPSSINFNPNFTPAQLLLVFGRCRQADKQTVKAKEHHEKFKRLNFHPTSASREDVQLPKGAPLALRPLHRPIQSGRQPSQGRQMCKVDGLRPSVALTHGSCHAQLSMMTSSQLMRSMARTGVLRSNTKLDSSLKIQEH